MTDWKTRQRDALRKRLQDALERHPGEAQTWIEWNEFVVRRHQEREAAKRNRGVKKK